MMVFLAPKLHIWHKLHHCLCGDAPEGIALRALLFPQYLIPTENSGFSVRDGTQRSCISRILKLRGEELLDKH